MLNQVKAEHLTPREQMTWAHEKEMADIYNNHAVQMKKLDLELARAEAKWSSWLRLPKLFLLSPVLIILSVGAVISALRKSDFPEKFWDLLR